MGRVIFIPFGEWDPDGSEFSQEGVHTARNVLPGRRGYRPFQKLSTVASLASTAPILRAYAHIFDKTPVKQKAVPIADVSIGNWCHPGGSSTTDLWEAIDEELFDDSDYVVSGGAPTSDKLKVGLKLAQAPGSNGHDVYFRYRIFGCAAADNWTLVVRLIQGASTVVASKTVTGTGDKDWTLDSFALSSGEIATLVAADYDTNGLDLEFDATTDGSTQTINPAGDVIPGKFEDELGGVTSLHAKIADVDDTTYAISRPLEAAQRDRYRFAFGPGERPPKLKGSIFRVRRYATNTGFSKMRVQLFAGSRRLTDIRTDTTAVQVGTVESVDISFDSVFPPTVLQWATDLPSADVTNSGWTLQGSGTGIFDRLKDDDDATYAESVSGGGNAFFEIDFGNAFDVAAATNPKDQKLILRAAHTHAGTESLVGVQLIKSGVVLHTTSFWVEPGGAFKDYEVDLSPWSAITDFKGIRIRVFTPPRPGTLVTKISEIKLQVTPAVTGEDAELDWSEVDWFDIRAEVTVEPDSPLPASTVWATDRPGTDVQNVDWSLQGSGTGVFDRLADDSDASYVESLNAGGNSVFQVDFANTFDLDAYTKAEKQIVIRAANTDGATARALVISAMENGVAVNSATISVASGGAFADYTVDISGWTGVTDFENLRLKVVATRVSGASFRLRVAEAKLQLAAARRAVITKASLILPSKNFIGVSWGQFTFPEAGTGSTAGDFDGHSILAATATRIYEVDPYTGFTDRSKGGAAYTVSPRGWDICSWGEYAILTNYKDNVQKWKHGDAAASDLITGASKPKARLCAMARDQLVLGDLNFSGAFADELWFSKINDAANFDDASSIRQRLRQTPGQVIRLIGGEDLIIFKRASILRGEFIGAPAYWRFSVVSDSIGTDQPWSVLKVGDRILFKGQGEGEGWYQLVRGAAVESIDGKVRDFFFEHSVRESYGPIGTNPDPGVRRVSSTDPRTVAGRIVGGQCGSSGLAIWSYRGTHDSEFRNSKAAAFNPDTGGFSPLDFEQDRVSEIVDLSNLSNDAAHFLRGVGFFTWNGATVTYSIATGGEVYSFDLGGKVHQFDPEKGRTFTVGFIRPFFEGRRLIQRTLLAGSLGLLPPTPRTSMVPSTWYSKDLELRLDFADDEFLERNAHSITVSLDKATKDGWIPVDRAGKFVRVLFVGHSLNYRGIRQIPGVQLMVDAQEAG